MTNSTIDKIEQVRVQGIDAIVAQLHDLLGEYGNPNYSCPSGNYSFECGSILFGALTREMQSAGLLVHNFMPSFSNTNLWEVVSKVQGFRSPSWCYPGNYRTRSRHPCSLEERVTNIVNSIIGSDNGLDLEDFERI